MASVKIEGLEETDVTITSEGLTVTLSVTGVPMVTFTVVVGNPLIVGGTVMSGEQ